LDIGANFLANCFAPMMSCSPPSAGRQELFWIYLDLFIPLVTELQGAFVTQATAAAQGWGPPQTMRARFCGR
jgi:hypothetical protein